MFDNACNKNYKGFINAIQNERYINKTNCNNENILTYILKNKIFIKKILNIMDILIYNNFNISIGSGLDNLAPIHIACVYGYLPVVKYLILCNKKQETLVYNTKKPFHYACKYNHLDIVKYLINLNIDCTNIIEKQIKIICMNGNVNMLKYLIKKNINSNFNKVYFGGNTLCHYACYNKDVEILKYLINLGYNINIKNDKNHTLFHIACMNGCLNIVKYLYNLNVNIYITDKRRCSPFYLACENGCLNVVKYLYNLVDLDINQEDIQGFTILNTVCYYRRLNIIKYICSLPYININKKDKFGFTPFDTACSDGTENIVKYLIDIGIYNNNIHISDNMILYNSNYNKRLIYNIQKKLDNYNCDIELFKKITNYILNPLVEYSK